MSKSVDGWKWNVIKKHNRKVSELDKARELVDSIDEEKNRVHGSR